MSVRILLAVWCVVQFQAWAGPQLEKQLATAGENAPEIRAFVEAAAEGFGAFGEKAAVFLVEGMPERDLQSLDKSFLLENLAPALKAREEFPWARALPEDVFFNDVLPYASLDETRESWRNEFYRLQLTTGNEHRSISLQFTKSAEVTKDIAWSELQPDDTAIQALRDWLSPPADKRRDPIPESALSKEQSEQAAGLVWNALKRESRAACGEELDAKLVKAAGKEMRYLERSFGKAAAGQRSLWISMHGGGGAATRVNDSQWRNQIRLYQPKEGIVVAPRAPTDAWNLWHQSHIDDLFDRLITNFVIGRGVDPGRVYLMGYSAGGDGVYQLAPRMADRFAAAAMMAGHPNDASPLGLRNLPFMIFVGGNDAAYNRNKVAAGWGEKLSTLREKDQGGYPHKTTIYKGLGHWMNGKDAEALPWMAERRRIAWPKNVVWHQSGRTHNRFYWLAVPEDTAQKGQMIRAEFTGQQIDVQAEGRDQLILRLSDQLVDLDQPVVVAVNGKEKFNGKVQRTAKVIWESLQQRMDPGTVATGEVKLQF